MKQTSMSRDEIATYVTMAYEKADPKGSKYVVDMFTRWITGGFISSHGRFIVTAVRNCKMTLKSYESAKFTCEVTALVYPDFKKTAKVKYTWTLKGRNYHGEYSEL